MGWCLNNASNNCHLRNGFSPSRSKKGNKCKEGGKGSRRLQSASERQETPLEGRSEGRSEGVSEEPQYEHWYQLWYDRFECFIDESQLGLPWTPWLWERWEELREAGESQASAPPEAELSKVISMRSTADRLIGSDSSDSSSWALVGVGASIGAASAAALVLGLFYCRRLHPSKM